MNKIGRIIGSESWLKLKSGYVHNKIIDIKKCGDIHAQVRPCFIGTQTVFLSDCNKNFVFYWLDRITFPNIKTIYLSNHPCEYTVLHRFKRSNCNFYLNDRFKFHKPEWDADLRHIILISDDKIRSLLNELSEEPLLITNRD